MKLRFLDKIGTLGAFLAAATCPACFPLLAIVGSIVGLGLFRRFEGAAIYILQLFVLIALVGNVISYFSHKKIVPLIVGLMSPILIFFAFYVRFNRIVVYIGLFGLLITAVLNYLENRKCRTCGPEEKRRNRA